jgi:hypothetical protein
LDRLFLGIAMIENFSTLIGKLVSGGQPSQDYSSIPVPFAVEFNTDEAWQDFQESQSFYDMEYATTVCGAL